MDNEKMWEEIAKLQGEFTAEVLTIAGKYGENKEEVFCKVVDSFEYMGLLFIVGAANVKEGF